jgi:hypothetical protein
MEKSHSELMAAFEFSRNTCKCASGLHGGVSWLGGPTSVWHGTSLLETIKNRAADLLLGVAGEVNVVVGPMPLIYLIQSQ